MPREKYDGVLLTRGGGAYYSFALLTNVYGNGSDLGLEHGSLRSGFAGADFGFITALGDVPIDSVDKNVAPIRFLADFVTPNLLADARVQQERAAKGFEVDGFSYRDVINGEVNNTYAVRSINYRVSDLLVAFRITRQDADGSLIIVWKILNRYGVPPLSN
jgi:hypothetical protein